MRKNRRIVARVIAAALSAAACAERPPEIPAGVDFHVRPAPIGDSLRVHGAGPLRFRGAIALQSRNDRIGGFSGLHVSDDGTRLVAVGWGGWLRGRLGYDRAGNLSGFALEGESPILDQVGRPIEAGDDLDAESLAYDGERYYVGFETKNRIWRYARIDGPAEPVELPTEHLSSIPGWGGFSSVVLTGRGELLALTEGWQDPAGNTHGLLWGEEGIQVISLRAAHGWLPVDLALLPGGDLLLAEVRKGESGLYDNTRFSRIEGSEIRAGAIMRPTDLAILRPPDHRERIEGVHAIAGHDGGALIYAISDSRRGWPTTILMFELVEE